jgi:hypothetical protein
MQINQYRKDFHDLENKFRRELEDRNHDNDIWMQKEKLLKT